MSSSKHWALYATNRRLGTHGEHRNAAARLGPVRVGLESTVPKGWEWSVRVGRLIVAVRWTFATDDPRIKDFWDFVMPPTVRARLTQAIASSDAGRGYRWDPRSDGRDVPLATWRPDDPEQPAGWHHDGRRWVLNEDGGWFRDRYGMWRYNKPGDPGWRELDNGSWRYDAAAAP